jgi:tetratricopeptide (TPR) repeat protein
MASVPHSSSVPSSWQRTGEWTLLLTVGLCIARALMLETTREPLQLNLGGMVLSGAGASVTAVLDWLSYIPALLVCARALFDDSFRLRWPKSVLFLSLLGVWAISSVFWSADRFAAAVNSGRLLAGASLFWAAAQLVRDWRAFRIVTASLVGLLAVLLVHSLIYQMVDMPQTRQNWEANHEQILSQQGWAADSFQAKRFEMKVLSGELMGFCASPNSLAALTVMLLMLTAGDLVQKLVRWRPALEWILPAGLLLGAGWVIWGTHSRTAAATPLIGVVLLAAGWRLRDRLAGHRRLSFAGGIAALMLGWAGLIGYGLSHGNLIEQSLTFRWKYWIASMHLIRDHLLKGIAWDNFGLHYLQYRLPGVPEEIKDPHNLVVRFAAELGMVGLCLAAGWLGSLAWELTRPAREGGQLPSTPKPQGEQTSIEMIRPFLWIAGIATVVSTWGAVDLSQDLNYWAIELLYRLLYGFTLVFVASWVAIVDFRQPRLDETPSPMLLMAGVVSLALFVLHNFIDFSMFEAGPWYIFIVMAGACVGMRLALARKTQETVGSRGVLMAGLGMGLAWVGSGILIVIPVVAGEQAGHRGDVAYAGQRFPEAAKAFQEAYDNSLWLHDHEYLLRGVRAASAGGAGPGMLLGLIDQAIAANPRQIDSYLMRVDVRLRHNLQPSLAAEDLTKAIELNPTDIDLQLRAAEVIGRVGSKPLALSYYERALALNEAFPKGEIKRLSARQVEEIQSKIRQFGGS